MLRSQRAGKIRSWFCASVHRSLYLPLTLSTSALLCKQMFFLRCQFSPFSHLEKVFFRAKTAKWEERKQRNTLLGSETEGELWTDSCFWRNTVDYSKTRGGESEAAVYLPHLWCVVLSNEDARPGYWWPRYGRRICAEERTWAWGEKTEQAWSATEDTLRTFKKPSVPVFRLCSLSFCKT